MSGAGLGWLVGAGARILTWSTVEVELSGSRQSQTVGLLDVGLDTRALMAGPSFHHARGRIRWFIRVLGGGTRLDLRARARHPIPVTATFAVTRGAWQLGGGADVWLTGRLRARLVYDYRRGFGTELVRRHRFMIGAGWGFFPRRGDAPQPRPALAGTAAPRRTL